MNKKAVATHFLMTALLVTGFSIDAQEQIPRQCLEMPERNTPCRNLIYSSYHENGNNKVFCLCKNDKQPLLRLLQSATTPSQLKQIRKLVSQHRLTNPELISLLQSVH